MSGQEWREQAACRDVRNADVFFPARETGYRVDRAAAEMARAICDGCPVWEQCLRAVLAVPSRYDRDGIFAGMTARDRRDLRGDERSSRHRKPVAHLLGGPLDEEGRRVRQASA